MPRFLRGAIVCALPALLVPTSAPNAQDPDAKPPRYNIVRLDNIEAEIGALRYVLTEEENAALSALPSDREKRRWIDYYWKGRDPISTSVENEVRLEHERRVAYARSEFRIPEWPGWDHRGIMYIRYGAPAHRSIAPAEAGLSFAPPREYWYYAELGMVVMFEDALASGNFETTIFSARSAGTLRLYKVDTPTDGPMNDEGTDQDMPPDFADRIQPDKWIAMLARVQEVIEETPSTYATDFLGDKLPMYFDVKRFRGGDAVDRVDVNIEFVADLSPGPRGDPVKTYVATAVFWDTDGNEAGRDDQRIDLPASKSGQDSTRTFPSQLQFSVSPDFYHMAVTVEEKNSGKFSSFRQDVRCPDFDTRLAASDIVLASRIVDATRPSPFNRGPLLVVPHPFGRYNTSGTIPVYFEVYNLKTGANGFSRYTVKYEIVAREPRKPGFWGRLFGKEGSPFAIAASFKGSGRGGEDRVNISISAENLWPGEFDIKVSIVDDLADAETETKATFHIVEDN